MAARGKTAKHVRLFHDRASVLAALSRGARLSDLDQGRGEAARARAARALAATLGTAKLSDLTPDRVQGALGLLREAGRSNQTAGHYRAALGAFARWARDNGRVRDDPTRGVKGFNAAEDRRHERRCLSDGELARLVAAAERGRALFGMPGPLRAAAYRVAAGTGFRAEELRALTPESFDLGGPEPSVSLAAGAAKNRLAVRQPIPTALARGLTDWLAGKPPGVPVLPLHHETAKAIRADLEAAGVPYETEDGVADFHSLRAYYVSALVRSGASIKEVQTLARHAKPQTTLNHYAKVSVRNLRGAVESLPVPPRADIVREAADAAGTDPPHINDGLALRGGRGGAVAVGSWRNRTRRGWERPHARSPARGRVWACPVGYRRLDSGEGGIRTPDRL